MHMCICVHVWTDMHINYLGFIKIALRGLMKEKNKIKLLG